MMNIKYISWYQYCSMIDSELTTILITKYIPWLSHVFFLGPSSPDLTQGIVSPARSTSRDYSKIFMSP